MQVRPRIVLYQPEIPHNTGALMRLSACLDVPLDLIGPLGFHLTDRHLARAGLDYRDRAQLSHWADWQAFLHGRGFAGSDGADHKSAQAASSPPRLLLLTTRGDLPYGEFRFSCNDSLMFGSESSGVPDHVRARADASLRIAMVPGCRSLNLALSAAMVIGEVLRQTGGFPTAAIDSKEQ